MRVSRRILATCVAVIAGGALTAASPADAVTRSRHEAEAEGAVRASVTDIREILNQRSDQVDVINRENGTSFAIQANGRWAGSMWVPWASGTTEAKVKCILIYDGSRLLWVYQDYLDSNNTVKYRLDGSYGPAVAVPGSSTGGGRKRLIVRSDGSLFMENTN